MADVHGFVEPGFEAVRELFEQQFDNGEQLGAGVAVYHRGRPVVDLWGGAADEGADARAWDEETMAVTYSVTKGLTATCVHVLADRGLIDYAAPVAAYWPEFAQHGKEKVTVAHVLLHQAGIPQIPEGTTAEDTLDWDKMIRGMEGLTPAWEPGTETGYHALNFGWLAGELVRRVDGRTVGRFLRDEVCAPLSINQMHLGAPAEVEAKIAKLVSRIVVTPEMEVQRAALAATTTGRASTVSGDLQEVLDSPAGHQAEIPAIGGIMSARALARMYACLAGYGELDGVRLMSEATVRKASERQTYRADRVLILPIGWAMGYMTGGAPGWPQGPRVTSFGHSGFGGSMGFADPEIGMSFGLVVNAITSDILGYVRAAALAAAARACIEAAETAA